MARYQFGGNASQWRGLSGLQKSGFARLGQHMIATAANGTARPMHPYQCFMAVNMTRAAQNLPMLSDAPLAPDPLPFLTRMTLAAVLTPRPGQPVPHLSLIVSGTPAACALQIYAAPPGCDGAAPPADTRYVSIGCCADFSAGHADITSLFQTRYTLPSAGYKLWLKLVPISPNGFRGQPVIVETVANFAP